MKKSVGSAINKVVWNWRIRKRLPRITKKAIELGYLKDENEINVDVRWEGDYFGTDGDPLGENSKWFK